MAMIQLWSKEEEWMPAFWLFLFLSEHHCLEAEDTVEFILILSFNVNTPAPRPPQQTLSISAQKTPDKMMNESFLFTRAHTHARATADTNTHKAHLRQVPFKMMFGRVQTLALETAASTPFTSKLPFMSLSGAKMASINQGARCNLQCPECEGRGCGA